MTIRRTWHSGGRSYSEDIPTINITRKERAVDAFKKTRNRTDDEIASFIRGYEAAEWDFEMTFIGLVPNYSTRP